jgi:hypothetical protein
MTVKLPESIINRRGNILQTLAGYTLSKPLKALVGNPLTKTIENIADGRANAVFIHGVGDDPESVYTALSKIPPRDLLYNTPVTIKRTTNGYVIESIDEDADTYFSGAEARNNQVPVYLNQLLYGTLHPEPENGSMKVLVIGAFFDGYFIDDQLTADFSTSPNDTSANPINIPTTNGRALAVLVQLTPSTGALSYKQSAEFDATLNLIHAYQAGLLPEADTTTHRIGYVKLVAGATVLGYDKLWAVPELLNKPLPASSTASYQSKSANYTLIVSDGTIGVDASGGAITITLLSAVGIAGNSYNIKALDVSGGNITIATTSSQTIDGALTQTLNTQWDNITVQSTGANWIII